MVVTALAVLEAEETELWVMPMVGVGLCFHRRVVCAVTPPTASVRMRLSAPTTGVSRGEQASNARWPRHAGQHGRRSYVLRRTRASRIAVTNATTNAGRATMIGHIASENTRIREC